MQTDNLYSHYGSIVSVLQRRLAQRADPAYAEWYRHNVKPTAPVRGVRMQDLRHLVMAWYEEWHKDHQLVANTDKIEVTFLLLQAKYVDDRLAAMVFIDEILISAGVITPDHLDRFATLFPPGLISDFKACDHFAAKVLQPLLIRFRSAVSEKLSHWFRAQSVWQARAALSALTPFASDAIHDELLLLGCAIVLARPEEEAKSIVGSALRALGRVHPELVENFLHAEQNLLNTNAASLNKATSFLGTGRAQYFRDQKRMLTTMSSQHNPREYPTAPVPVPAPASVPAPVPAPVPASASAVVSAPASAPALSPNLLVQPHSVSPSFHSDSIQPALNLPPLAIPPTQDTISVERSVDNMIRPFEGARNDRHIEPYEDSDPFGHPDGRILDDRVQSTNLSVPRLLEGSVSSITTHSSFLPHSQLSVTAHEAVDTRARVVDPARSRRGLFSLSGEAPVTLPHPTDDSRLMPLNRVAHGRITRSESGLRRPLRRIHDIEGSFSPPARTEAMEQGVEGGHDANRQNQGGSRRGGSRVLEGENDGSKRER